MSEDPVTLKPEFLSLPVEVLHAIGEFLKPRDLLAVSAACRYLRSVFNIDSLWQKYTHGGSVSLSLNSTKSLVKSKYKNPCITSLEPLCEHRLHFLKQSRLLHNFRKGIFVPTGAIIHMSRYQALKLLDSRQITYHSKYLFIIDSENGVEVIKIFDFELAPKHLLTVNLEEHDFTRFCFGGSSCRISWFQVVKDKLIVRRIHWFDIYHINLPDSLQFLHSINVYVFGCQEIDKKIIIGTLLFVENSTWNVVNVWDLENGNRCSDLDPKISGPDFKILGCSQDENLVLLSVGMFPEEPSEPHIFLYDIKLNDFSSFSPILNKDDFKSITCYGLINSDYVVILNQKLGLNYSSVFVFNRSNSLLISQKTNLCCKQTGGAKTIDDHLVFPTSDSILIMDLKSLQIIWELQLISVNSDLDEYRTCSMMRMEVLHISILSSIIAVHTGAWIVLWDFHTRKKILEVPVNGLVALNNTLTKLIIIDYDRISVLCFW